MKSTIETSKMAALLLILHIHAVQAAAICNASAADCPGGTLCAAPPSQMLAAYPRICLPCSEPRNCADGVEGRGCNVASCGPRALRSVVLRSGTVLPGRVVPPLTWVAPPDSGSHAIYLVLVDAGANSVAAVLGNALLAAQFFSAPEPLPPSIAVFSSAGYRIAALPASASDIQPGDSLQFDSVLTWYPLAPFYFARSTLALTATPALLDGSVLPRKPGAIWPTLTWPPDFADNSALAFLLVDAATSVVVSVLGQSNATDGEFIMPAPPLSDALGGDGRPLKLIACFSAVSGLTVGFSVNVEAVALATLPRTGALAVAAQSELDVVGPASATLASQMLVPLVHPRIVFAATATENHVSPRLAFCLGALADAVWAKFTVNLQMVRTRTPNAVSGLYAQGRAVDVRFDGVQMTSVRLAQLSKLARSAFFDFVSTGLVDVPAVAPAPALNGPGVKASAVFAVHLSVRGELCNTSRGLDLVIALDRSASLGPAAWTNLQRPFAQGVIRALGHALDAGAVRTTAIVRYGSDVTPLVAGWNLRSANLLQALDASPAEAAMEATWTLEALETIRHMYLTDNPNVTRAVLLLTDGQHSPGHAATALHDSLLLVFGAQTRNYSALAALASHPAADNVRALESFGDFSALAARLEQLACAAPPPSPPPPVPPAEAVGSTRNELSWPALLAILLVVLALLLLLAAYLFHRHRRYRSSPAVLMQDAEFDDSLPPITQRNVMLDNPVYDKFNNAKNGHALVVNLWPEHDL